MGFDTFVGKKIGNIYINSKKDTMYWNVDDKWYKVDAIGDCCSHSWFEHCDNGEAIQNTVLVEFENVCGDTIDTDYDNVIQVNMLKFKTGKGYCTIEFRNESNGYYSGWTEMYEVSGLPDEKLVKLGDF